MTITACLEEAVIKGQSFNSVLPTYSGYSLNKKYYGTLCSGLGEWSLLTAAFLSNAMRRGKGGHFSDIVWRRLPMELII
eukprot:3549456-Amphidinium_carterae.2